MYNFIIHVIATPLSLLLKLLFKLTRSYGISLILFVVIYGVIQFPIVYKQRFLTVHKNKMQSTIDVIKDMNRYSTVRYKIAEAELFKRENYKPITNSIAKYLTTYVFIAIMSIVYNPLTYIFNVKVNVIGKLSELEYIRELSNGTIINDEIKDVISGYNFLGIPLYTIPSIDSSIVVLVLPFVYLVLQYLLLFINNKFKMSQKDSVFETKLTKSIKYVIPLVSVFLAFSIPSGVTIFWCLRSIYSIVETVVLVILLPESKVYDMLKNGTKKNNEVNSYYTNLLSNLNNRLGKEKSLNVFNDEELNSLLEETINVYNKTYNVS